MQAKSEVTSKGPKTKVFEGTRVLLDRVRTIQETIEGDCLEVNQSGALIRCVDENGQESTVFLPWEHVREIRSISGKADPKPVERSEVKVPAPVKEAPPPVIQKVAPSITPQPSSGPRLKSPDEFKDHARDPS